MKLILALTVFFSGIVSHVDLPSNETITVLPRAPQHGAYMCFNSADLVGSMPAASFIHVPSVTNVGCPSDYQIDLDNLTVSLEGINETKVTRTAGYNTHIIRLGDISTCRDLKPEVKAKTHDAQGHIAAYVLYPGGTFTVDRFFATKAYVPNKPPWDKAECIGCTVALTMKTTGRAATVRLTPKGGRAVTFQLRSAGVLNVKNSPASPLGKGHWRHHYGIFSNCQDIEEPQDLETTPCERFKCERSIMRAEFIASAIANGSSPDSDVECSNSNFP